MEQREDKKSVGAKVTRKWVARPLSATCGVCSSPASEVQHYGAIACYSCRAFFRRSIGSGKEYRFCKRKMDSCSLDPASRTNCKKCRLKKCLENGMRPEKVDRIKKKHENEHCPGSKSNGSKKNCEESAENSSEDVNEPVETASNRSSMEKCEWTSSVMGGRVDITRLAEQCFSEPLGGAEQLDRGTEQLVRGAEQLRGSAEQLVEGAEQLVGGAEQRMGSEKQLEGGAEQPVGDAEQLEDGYVQGRDHIQINDGVVELVEGCLELVEPKVNPQKRHSVITIHKNPEFDLTFEEDFKIHELIVRKENVLDTMLSLVIELTNFKAKVTHFASSPISSGEATPLDDISKIMVKEQVLGDIALGGILRQSLEMFDDQRMVDTRVKSETFAFTVSVMQLCLRAFLLENKDQGSFVDQYLAAGAFNSKLKMLYDQFYPGDRHAMKSFNPLKTRVFLSPWAVRPEDEEFFTSTLTMLGKVVGQDTKLGTLFYTLVLFTPGAKLSQLARNDYTLQKLQNETSLLIFRYLKMKYACKQQASETMNLLLKLVGDLHLCLHIHLHCRRGPLDGWAWPGWTRGYNVVRSILAFNSSVMTSLPQQSEQL